MYLSGFQNAIGCSDSPNSTLSRYQCDLMFSLQVISLLLGTFGCLIHFYVFFSYKFRQDERKVPIQTLIMWLSVFDFLYCFGLSIDSIMNLVPLYSGYFACVYENFIFCFWQYSLFMVVLLLALNRYFAICKPREYEYRFSNSKIHIYSLFILILTIFIGIVKLTEFCLFEHEVVKFMPHYKTIYLIWYILFNGPSIILTFVLYVKIYIKLRTTIAFEEAYNVASLGILTEDIEAEKSYLKSLTVSTVITLPIFTTYFLTNAVGTYQQIETPDLRFFPFTSSDNEEFLPFFADIFLEILFSLMFVTNPFVFYATSKDFRIKLSRPLRVLEGQMFRKKRLPVVELKTEINTT